MCGISGIICKPGNSFSPILLSKMTDIISHRGPDDEGFVLVKNQNDIVTAGGKDTPGITWKTATPYMPTVRINELSSQFYSLGFGSRRLSILDLSPYGHMPMSYLNKRYWITYNGEIYNYLELRSELEKLGFNFISKTDTEVILAAYVEWGLECLNHFNGMWAFAIYDTVAKSIFLSRDRFGIKPLYYWFSKNGDLCFGSEIKQFSVHPEWEPLLNPQRAYDYLVYSQTDYTDETLFKGVYILRPGHYMKFNINETEKILRKEYKPEKWYSLRQKKFVGSFEEASERFEKHFSNSIKLELRSDVPVGSALSGGLDSSAIVCEVNKVLRQSGLESLQKTFSACSFDKRFDERKWMDEVVNFTKVEAHFVYPSLTNLFETTKEIIWYQDEPYQSNSVYLGWHVFKMAKENDVKVLLNGQGADEYLGGYGQNSMARYSHMFKTLRWRSLLNDIKMLKINNGITNYIIMKGILNNILPELGVRFIRNISSQYSEIKTIFNWDSIGAKNIHPYDHYHHKLKTVSDISEFYLMNSPLPKYLRWEDRNSMANSIEARVPFLDHQLVEFSYSLPDDYLELRGETKRVLRNGLSDLLPDKIKNRKDKIGFIAPEEKWVKEEPGIFRQKIKEAVEITNGLINAETLKYFERIAQGNIPFDYTYWRIILFAEWAKRFNVKI
jgi:asparagine synthase (glutamine-hydrolysing)